MEHLVQSFSVKFSYTLFFSSSLFRPENTTLSGFFLSIPARVQRKILFVIDESVVQAQPDLTAQIETYFKQHQEVALIKQLLIIPGGEQAKNEPEFLASIIAAVDTHQIDRHSYIAAIGGGAILDLVGYAAAIAHRGIKHIRIPTTVLSQNDSGVGVKNGINYQGKKNFLGTFSPPAAVFNDDQFLLSLSDRDYYSGISEAIKVALIKDEEFFDWIERHAYALAERNSKQMNVLIKRCAALHLGHISGEDPFEMGSARPLDFGHWAAHKLEQLSAFHILHGEAVAIGIALDSTYSYLKGMIDEPALKRILALLNHFFDLNPAIAQIKDQQSPVLKGLAEFQEHLGGELTITLLSAIGRGEEVHEMDTNLLIAASTYVSNNHPTVIPC